MKSTLKYRLKVFNRIFLVLVVLTTGFSGWSQTSIEQDRVSRSNPTAQALQTDRTLRPARQLRIPENLIQIQKVSVPELTGRRFDSEQISAFLSERGLKLGNVVQVSSPQNGIIVNQYPPANRLVNPQTEVNISIGFAGINNLVEVPGYIGLTIERAVARMPNDRLQPGNIREVDSDASAGTVVSQFPEPGMQVDENTPINLDVSKGQAAIEKTTVPDLVGGSLEEGAEALIDARLFAGRILSQPSDAKNGQIISQSPPAGTEVDVNSSVDIIYARNEAGETTVVPDVVGMNRVNAIILIKESRLNYTQEFVRKKGFRTGVVVAQEIAPGQQVPVNTTLFIQIQDEATFPPWAKWIAGLVLAGAAGIFVGRKSGRQKRNKNKAAKKSTIEFNPVCDLGEQALKFQQTAKIENIDLKCIIDLGQQKIK